MNKEMKRYLKDIKLLLPIFGKEEKKYYQQLKKHIIKTFNNQTSYSEIVEEVGEPYEVVQAYYEEVGIKQFMFRLRLQKYIHYISIVIIATTIVLGLFRIYYLSSLYEEVKNAQPITVEEIIQEE
ncbi:MULTISPECIES: DUF6120 family protein [Bacillota]|uniref:Uncharacterized protein n=1 Tax=Massilimicrobiota timonensis TaxID=1776392 RepID=A0A1Y4SJR7_9FIRM|nr:MULTISPECIES: DUF6120 family protein [Bacillota]MBM6966005.1 hypothetical protein [Massilimicrobiota timonensis]OUQ30137.1 hypothetical protein B5E75_13835 [Massilimicrobiota timonensis]QUN12316.1 hypothetical protein KEC48_12660 [Clostridium sp. C1]